MESDIKILPINTSKETHINFYLSLILANNMHGWFYERYINLIMYNSIVDYVDNINYEGIIEHIRFYTWDEIKWLGLLPLVKQSIENNYFLNCWVDEYDLPCSVRYHGSHFVHPIIVYGYNNENDIYYAWFFDIAKGYRAVEISQQDFSKAIDNAKVHLDYYGNYETMQVLKLKKYIPSLPFNLQNFISQLRDYLYCQNNPLLQRFNTSGRRDVVKSENVVYGIQIYLYIMDTLAMVDRNDIFINFKNLHEFIMHKKQLVIRLKYIEKQYPTDDTFHYYILKMEQVFDTLEKARLLNLKYQMIDNGFSLEVSRNPNYLTKLKAALLNAYHLEMEIIPAICKLLTPLTYPRNYFKKYATLQLDMTEGICNDDYIEFELDENIRPIYRIDIVREGAYQYGVEREWLLLNKEFVRYIECDFSEHAPVRSISFRARSLKNLRLYTDIRKVNYKIILFLQANKADANNDSQ